MQILQGLHTQKAQPYILLKKNLWNYYPRYSSQNKKTGLKNMAITMIATIKAINSVITDLSNNAISCFILSI